MNAIVGSLFRGGDLLVDRPTITMLLSGAITATLLMLAFNNTVTTASSNNTVSQQSNSNCNPREEYPAIG